MLVKNLILSMFFMATVQANENPQSHMPSEVPPFVPGGETEQQHQANQEPPPVEPLEEQPLPEDYSQMVDEPPPPDFYDADPGQSHFGNQPVTPYKVLKVVKQPVAKKIANLPPQKKRTSSIRNLAAVPLKKKVAGIKSVKPFCSMRALASSASKELGKTRSRSRLWVEEVNPSWFKVYRRAGAAFIQASCLR
ncbi:MAG: hypothetical protein A4S09_09705 [Proteobacteria bacterium SG_bin7]|nr:MAG: hypothetical protein A4S09_09705 [Proteobacteria bacterium SG_bin7]